MLPNRPIRVLVVDDAVVIRKIVTDVLKSDPEIEVVGTAADGHIALQKITQVNPDIITLDVEMPVMDGLETLRQLRRSHPKLPVIMFSTLTERGAQATIEALALGASDYVTKPANIGKVGEALQLFISILNSGVSIVTREPRRTYSQDSINDIASLLEPLQRFQV